MSKSTNYILLGLCCFGLNSCFVTRNDNSSSETFVTSNSSASSVAEASTGPYSLFVASGFPLTTGVGAITEWSSGGNLIRVTKDYSINTAFMPQSLAEISLNNFPKLLSLGMNTTGRVDIMDLDGSDFQTYIDNPAALIAGTRRIAPVAAGGLLAAKAAGVEQFNASLQRVGTAARFINTGTCASTVTTDVAEVTIAGVPYVISNNMVLTPNNKLNLYNGNTGACIAGAAPTGPAVTVWPFAMDYSSEQSKLFVLYYPFTAAVSNAQIWSFNVSATTISGGTLVYNDIGGNIATNNATPQNLSGDIDYYEDSNDKFIFVATSFNSVLRLSYDSTTGLATLPAGQAFLSGSAWLRSISSILAVPE